MNLEAIGIGRKAAEHWLLRDITFCIQPGDRVALVGPTGSGKTLLLRSLAMLDPVDAGEIRWLGKTVPGAEIPAYRSRVIYLQQRPALMEGTVEFNLRQPYLLRVHRETTFDRIRIIALLDSLGRDESFLAKQQRDLSGGESQLTTLLRAIQFDPAMLLLDEPTAALDIEATGMVEKLVGNWLDEQPAERAAVWVTHDREQARRISQSMMQIREGRLY